MSVTVAGALGLYHQPPRPPSEHVAALAGEALLTSPPSPAIRTTATRARDRTTLGDRVLDSVASAMSMSPSLEICAGHTGPGPSVDAHRHGVPRICRRPCPPLPPV